MQQATSLQLPDQMSPNSQSCPQPQPHPTPSSEAKAQLPEPQREATMSQQASGHQQALEKQTAKEKLEPGSVPHLRVVVESQAFKNVLVDEMDMMMAHAATLIQATWRGYRLRQKLVSQMTAAKAIQEAWRRFNARRILHPGKGPGKEMEEDENIPYHPPQQVRFQRQLQEGEKPLPLRQPQLLVANKETQFPSLDSLVTCVPQQDTQKLPAMPDSQEPSAAIQCVPGASSAAFLPRQPVTIRFPCPMHVDTKCQQPCLLTRTIRSSCVVHIEGETVKHRHVTTRTIKAGTAEPALSAKCVQVGSELLKTQTQTQVRAEAEAPKSPPQVGPVSVRTKIPPQIRRVVATTKVPSQTWPAAAVSKIPPQTRTAVVMTKIPPQECLMSPITKTSSQTRPVVTMACVSPQICPVAKTTKTPPQHATGTTTKTTTQTHSVAAMAKIPPQTCPVAKTPPQARVAAMITRTPAQIRSVANFIKAFCLPPAATGNLKAPLQASIASEIPKALSHTRLNTAKVKGTFIKKQADATLEEASSHSYTSVGKPRCPPEKVGEPKTPASPHWETEKSKVCPQEQTKTEVASKTNADTGVGRTLPCAKGVEDRSKDPSQGQGKKEVIRIQPQACAPVEVVVTPCQVQPATTLTKTQCQAYLPMELAKTLSQTLSKTLYQAQLVAGLTKGHGQAQTPARPAKVGELIKTQLPAQNPAGLANTQSQAQQMVTLTSTHFQAQRPSQLTKGQFQAQQVARVTNSQIQQQMPARFTKAQYQTQEATGLTKAQAQAQAQIPIRLAKTESQTQQETELTRTQVHAQTPPGMTKIQSQTQVVTELTKAQTPAKLTQQLTRLNKTLSQAQLATETATPLCPAYQATDLSKMQFQPKLAINQPSQHLCNVGLLPHGKQDNRLSQLPAPSVAMGKTTQGPRPPSVDTQGMLVPLLDGHPPCNIESSWGDAGAARAPSPVHSQPVLCPEETTTPQLASLCAELATVLSSQEDLRSLLSKALSQSEVRAALTHVLSKEVLGATAAKALPQGMLSAALAKALSWSELGVAMSRALSRTELRTELARAMQSRLADVLSKTLTDDERVTLSQALCQGELGAVLNTSLSQASLRTATVLPKAAMKPAFSSLAAEPGAVEIDCRGTPSAVWKPTLGPTRTHPSKVRVPCNGAWEEMGDGATFRGLPDLLGVSLDGSLTRRETTTIHQCSLILGLNPQVSCEVEDGTDLSRLCLNQVVSGDEALAISGTDPNLPQLRPPPSLRPSLIASGIGPSTNQPSATSGISPSFQKPHIVNRVAPHSCSFLGVAKGVSSRLPSSVGSRKDKQSPQLSVTCRRPACWCHFLEITRGSSGVCPSSTTRGVAPGSQSPNHKQVSMSPKNLYSKGTLSRPPASMANKVACAGLGAAHEPLPGSVAPNTQSYLAAQANPNLLQAPSGLFQTPNPVSESTESEVSMSAVSQPQEPATVHHMPMLNKLVAPTTDTVLARNFSKGSMVLSNSQSSLQISSLASLSTMSTASLKAINLVEEHWEGSPEGNQQMGPLLPREAAGSPQESREMEEAGETHPGHKPPSPCQPTTTAELVPILHHRPMASHVSFSVCWGSESDTDVSLVPSSTDTIKSLSQVSLRTGLVRSLSLESMTHTLDQQPGKAQKSVVSSLAPNLSHPSLANGVVPSPSHSPVTSGVAPSLSPSSVVGGVASNLAQSAVDNRVAPSPNQSSVASTVAPSLAQLFAANRVACPSHLSAAGGVAPNPAQPSIASRVATSLSQPSAANRVAPSLAQSSVFSRVVLSLAQSSVTSRVSPSLAKPSAAIRVTPKLSQPSAASTMPTKLAHSSAASSVAPSLASVAKRVALSLSQPSVASRVPSNLVQSSVANMVAPSLASVARRVAPSLSQPFVPSNMSHSLDPPNLASRVDSKGYSSRVSAVAPSLHQPSMISEVTPGKPYPSVASVGWDQSQVSPDTQVDPSQDPLMDSGVASSLQCSKVREGCRSVSQSSAITVSTPNIYKTSVASGHRDQGISISQETLYRGMPPNMTQGTVGADMAPSRSQGNVALGMASRTSWGTTAAGKAPSMSQGIVAVSTTPNMSQRSVATGMNQSPSGMAPIASWVSVAGVPLTHERASVAPSFSQPPLTNRLAKDLSQASWSTVGRGISQVSSALPIALGHHCPSMATVLTPSYQQTNVLTQEAVVGTSSHFVLNAVASGMATAVAPGTVAGGVAPRLDPRSVRGMSPSLPPESMISVAQTLPLGSVTNGAAQTSPPGSMISGMAQTLPTPSVASSVAQTIPPGSVASGMTLTILPSSGTSGMAQTLPPGYVVSGIPQTFPPDYVASSMTQIFPPGSVASGMAQTLPPGLPLGPMASVAAPSLPPGSIGSGMAPSMATVGAPGLPLVFMDGRQDQGQVLGTTASMVTPVPIGSLLIGITSHPYHWSPAGEGSLTAFLASHATSMAQVHPQASEARTARNLPVATVLSRASQMPQAVGIPFKVTGSQAMLNLGEPDTVLSQVSESSEEASDINSEAAVTEANPWMYQERMGTDVEGDHKPLLEERILSEHHVPLLWEVAASHAKSGASGVAQTISSGSVASAVAHTFPSRYVASTLTTMPPPGPVAACLAPAPSQAPSLAKHSRAGSTTPTLQPSSAASGRTPNRVCSTPMMTVASRVLTQSQGVPRVPSDIPMVPQSHSQPMPFTSTSRSPQLLHGNSMAFNQPQESTAQMGSPSLSQWHRVSSVASHMPQQPSSASRSVSNQFQMDTNPDTHSLPMPEDMSQRSHHESVSRSKSFRSVNGSIVPDMLGGSLARLVPPLLLQEQQTLLMQGGTRCSIGTAHPGIICTSDRAHSTDIGRIPQGIHRVSLGYESSPSSSQRLLFDEGLQDSHSSVAIESGQHPSLTPTVLQGPTDANVASGQPWNAAVPSVVAGPRDSTTGPGSVLQLARGVPSRDAKATDSRRSGELLVSVHTAEKVVIHAVVVIQAHVRGYLVRRVIKVWHHSATIIQAVWHGYVVRKELSQKHAAARIIQAHWRGYHTRQDRYQQMLQPATWAMLGDRDRTPSEHRCFQSCQPQSCTFCQTLFPGPGGPPSVVLLVGSSPRTCHMCGQTTATRVVQGTGQGAGGQQSVPSQRGHGTHLAPLSPRLQHQYHKAATAIQCAWRGFSTRRKLKEQQVAAKRVQASWRGHFTRTCLTADSLLGLGMARNSPRHTQ